MIGVTCTPSARQQAAPAEVATTSAARSPTRRRATFSRSLSNERTARSTGCGDGLSLASAAIQAPALRPNRRVDLQSDVVAVDAFGSLKKRFPSVAVSFRYLQPLWY